MQTYVIDSDFIFFNNQTTPFENLFKCNTKLVKPVPNQGYNNINAWIKITEKDDHVSLTILPINSEHGKLFVSPPITQDAVGELAKYIKKILAMPVKTSYIVYNASTGLVDEGISKYFCV